MHNLMKAAIVGIFTLLRNSCNERKSSMAQCIGAKVSNMIYSFFKEMPSE